ncbi:UrcA family protein [Brevundimonas naejangsanensis]|uniref:UrcA family protein n=1 Tax=Brevundimonas naejangsanensis TaxID=588932 RepID=A0A494RG06_9CAUL|nr:UrcA family protein [Brevundimonas naejangsanensis]AYG94053.1 UrcA family protein [Brevundimonas naejangsanensis]
MFTAVAAALALAAAPPVAPSAADADDAMRVSFGDLTLERPEDAAILAGRIQAAAAHYCDRHRVVVTPRAAGAPHQCRAHVEHALVAALPPADWRAVRLAQIERRRGR